MDNSRHKSHDELMIFVYGRAVRPYGHAFDIVVCLHFPTMCKYVLVAQSCPTLQPYGL